MNQTCEQMIEESIDEFEEIDDEIYSESMFLLVDNYIDTYVTECMNNIFTSDSETTVYDALSDLISKLNNSDDSGSDSDSDYSMTGVAPEAYSTEISEEELRAEFTQFRVFDKNINHTDYVDTTDITNNDLYAYDDIFGDCQ